MRLEVLVEKEEPRVFPLKKPKILIGSHDACDIVIAAHGISRKHLLIQQEEDNSFVTDQGSTNGSFINEERLVPGRRVQFTSFFPIRLADNVLLTLLTDAEGNDYEHVDLSDIQIQSTGTSPSIKREGADTRMISLQELSKSNTENLVRKRQQAIVRKKVPSKNDKKGKKEETRMPLAIIASVLILGGAIYYNLYMGEETTAPVEQPVAVVGEVIKEPPTATRSTTTAISRVNDDNLFPREKLQALLSEIKCTSEAEKYLCDQRPELMTGNYGVVQSGLTLSVLVEAAPIREKVRQLIKYQTLEGIPSEDEEQVRFFSMLVLMHDLIPKDLNLSLLKDYTINLVLFENPQKIQTVAAFTAESLAKARAQLTEEQLSNLYLKEGAEAVRVYKNYYISY